MITDLDAFNEHLLPRCDRLLGQEHYRKKKGLKHLLKQDEASARPVTLLTGPFDGCRLDLSVSLFGMAFCPVLSNDRGCRHRSRLTVGDPLFWGLGTNFWVPVVTWM